MSDSLRNSFDKLMNYWAMLNNASFVVFSLHLTVTVGCPNKEIMTRTPGNFDI